MPSLSNESTPRERLARTLALLSRIRMFRLSTAAILAVGILVSLVVALRTSRAYRSETTVLYRDGVRPTMTDTESPAARAARLGPKLKDLVYARPRLERVIREYGLFPDKTSRSMLDAIEEMQTRVGFHARAGDSYVISFIYDNPATAQKIVARLAQLMIDEYDRQNLDTATTTRDFLVRKVQEANTGVDDANRALATFLAQHPQFQWGGTDSPYAPTPTGAPPPVRDSAAPSPVDPETRALLRELARVEAELAGPVAAKTTSTTLSTSEAQKQKDAAAAALAAAETARAEKLLSVTPAHPDAITAQARVEAARRNLTAAEAALSRARAGVLNLGAPREPLTPSSRAELERRRTSLRRRLEARRAAPGQEHAHAPASGVGAASVVELETEWHRLRLALDRARDQLQTLQQNARNAELAAEVVARQGREEMQILEPAYLPTRPDRGRGRVFFAGVTVAFFLAFGYAAARVLLDDKLLDEGDVAALGGPAVLVSMPRLPSPQPRPPQRAIVPAVAPDNLDDLDPLSHSLVTPYDGDPESPTSRASPLPSSCRSLALRNPGGRTITLVEPAYDDPEVEVIGADVDPDAAACLLDSAPPEALAALRVLRHRLEKQRGDAPFVVSVMSPGVAEGKTTLALRLALTLSEAERARVILVEGNFERPLLATSLGLHMPAGAGFSTQLRHRMNGHAIPWGVVRLSRSLSLLAEPGDHAAHPEAIHSAHFKSAIASLRRSYDYVLLDGPAVVGTGDANVIEAVSDGVLLVARVGATRGAELTRATQQLDSVRVMGLVLNDAVPANTKARPCGAGC